MSTPVRRTSGLAFNSFEGNSAGASRQSASSASTVRSSSAGSDDALVSGSNEIRHASNARDRAVRGWFGRTGKPGRLSAESKVISAGQDVGTPRRRHRLRAFLDPHNPGNDSTIPALQDLKKQLESLDLTNAEGRAVLERTLIDQSAKWHSLSAPAQEKLTAVLWRYLAPGTLSSHAPARHVPGNVLSFQEARSEQQPGRDVFLQEHGRVAIFRNLLGHRARDDTSSTLRMTELLSLARDACLSGDEPEADVQKIQLLTSMVSRASELRFPPQLSRTTENARLHMLQASVMRKADATLDAASRDTDPDTDRSAALSALQEARKKSAGNAAVPTTAVGAAP